MQLGCCDCADYEVPSWSMFDFDGSARDIVSLLKELKSLNFINKGICETAILRIIDNNHSLTFLEFTIHFRDESKIKGRFIVSCHGISRTTPMTVSMESLVPLL